jgi:hypothetical protein
MTNASFAKIAQAKTLLLADGWTYVCSTLSDSHNSGLVFAKRPAGSNQPIKLYLNNKTVDAALSMFNV